MNQEPLRVWRDRMRLVVAGILLGWLARLLVPPPQVEVPNNRKFAPDLPPAVAPSLSEKTPNSNNGKRP